MTRGRSASVTTGRYPIQPVRPYVVTRGRSTPSRNTIRPETIVATTRRGEPLPLSAGRAERTLLDLCQGPLSLAETAAHLQLSVSAILVLASDLVDSGHLSVRTQATSRAGNDLLQELLNGLRKLA